MQACSLARVSLGPASSRRGLRRPAARAPCAARVPRPSASAAAAADGAGSKPTIELTFEDPKGGPPQKVSCASGSVLRAVMLTEKIELYDLMGKVLNCGGGGSCGTCIVACTSGAELLSPRTDAEGDKLRKRPDNWRLACQTVVGDESNSGAVSILRLPQSKK